MKVTLKLATSLDGRIATASGESKWITGETARQEVHRLRAVHNAVLIGVETAIADDPDLSVRLQDYEGPQPRPVVLDSRLRTPPSLRLIQTAEQRKTILVTIDNSNDCLTSFGATVIKVAAKGGRPAPVEVLTALAKAGIGSVMIEGGGQVAASFLSAGLVDAMEWFRAPVVLGNEGRPAVSDFVLKRLADAPRFRRLEVRELGDDLWERYEKT